MLVLPMAVYSKNSFIPINSQNRNVGLTASLQTKFSEVPGWSSSGVLAPRCIRCMASRERITVPGRGDVRTSSPRRVAQCPRQSPK